MYIYIYISSSRSLQSILYLLLRKVRLNYAPLYFTSKRDSKKTLGFLVLLEQWKKRSLNLPKLSHFTLAR